MLDLSSQKSQEQIKLDKCCACFDRMNEAASLADIFNVKDGNIYIYQMERNVSALVDRLKYIWYNR